MYMLTAFLDWVNTWPAAVFAALAASSLTLSGVLFSDWRNTVRLKKQHDFAAEESQRTRVAGVRKEVYLPAAGIIARMQEYLIALPGVARPIPESPMVEFADLAGKIALVGSMKTVLLAQQLAAAYSEVHMKLIMLAKLPHDSKITADLHQEYRVAALSEVKRVDLEIAKFLGAGGTDQRIFDALQRSRDTFHNSGIEEWRKENEALNAASKGLNKYILQALELIEPLGELSVLLLISAREELGQPTESNEIIRIAKQNRERLLKLAQEALAALELEYTQ